MCYLMTIRRAHKKQKQKANIKKGKTEVVSWLNTK